MKRYHVIGIENKKGDFTNDAGQKVPYDNMLLKCIVQSTSARDKKKIMKGFDVEEVKIRNDFDELVYKADFNVYNMTDLVGCCIELDQNVEGKIECIEVVSGPNSELLEFMRTCFDAISA